MHVLEIVQNVPLLYFFWVGATTFSIKEMRNYKIGFENFFGLALPGLFSPE
jgi:hypothetical protein